ncbi:MAG: TIGR00270 family protein [Candidatus Methanoliparum thermophilum]|uniref:TIGR00270 family protein n=1 Tax=Methanoliparum thermophilum TaxID=2491083 RepID=A0A520KST3_METT2|nr:multiprotein bridging factor aMBF1 [Candidatus Methanoliparum sp. LAM-1]RZN64971.1 MAG: TIGR00270 family protein [Candidatus Methanoliparum thermophilum]BDC36146.1 transcriptional regulator [Candidatus Methanoliparum sp. LAM-1]
MECEICGENIKGEATTIEINGTIMNVCPKCSKFGKKVFIKKDRENRRPLVQKTTKNVIDLKEELVSGYYEIIRREREKRCWDQKDLAKKINEKESIIKKIEKGDISLDDKIREKLERLFKIKLTEPIKDVHTHKIDNVKRDLTLGDVVNIKRK